MRNRRGSTRKTPAGSAGWVAIGAIATALVLALGACGSGDPSPASPEPSAPAGTARPAQKATPPAADTPAPTAPVAWFTADAAALEMQRNGDGYAYRTVETSPSLAGRADRFLRGLPDGFSLAMTRTTEQVTPDGTMTFDFARFVHPASGEAVTVVWTDLRGPVDPFAADPAGGGRLDDRELRRDADGLLWASQDLVGNGVIRILWLTDPQGHAVRVRVDGKGSDRYWGFPTTVTTPPGAAPPLPSSFTVGAQVQLATAALAAR